MSHKKSICIDFDGVINSYVSGYKDGLLPDPPVPGAIAWLKELIASDLNIIIHSARLNEVKNKALMQDWLLKHGIIAEELGKLRFEAKPIAKLYIDDLAWKFTGKNFPTPEEISKNKPWYKKDNKIIAKLNYIVKALTEPTVDEKRIIIELTNKLFEDLYYQGIILNEETLPSIKRIVSRILDQNIKQIETNR